MNIAPTTSFHVRRAVALLLVAAAPATAQVQDLTTFARNGTTTLNASNQLVLTPALKFQDGSAFRVTPVPTTGLQSFTAMFNYTISGGTGADGLAFALQGRGPNTLGGAGGNVGYGGIDHSVGALLRTFSYDIVQIDTNGSLSGNAAPSATLRGTNDVTVTYAAGTQLLSVFLNGAPVVSASGIDLGALVGPEAYVGFTAATGEETDEQRINSFSFNTTYQSASTVPEPTTIVLVSAGLLTAAGVARRRRGPTV